MGARAVRVGLPVLAVLTAPLLAGTGAEAQPPAGPAPAWQTCAKTCHTEILGHRVMHGPAQRSCETCHVQGDPEKHTFFLTAKPEELCVRCHALVPEAVTHVPVAQKRCLECHDPHGSEHKAMLVADPGKGLCLKCHTNNFAQRPHVHGPVAVGACIVCHEPHTSALPALLVEGGRSLCLTCHAEIAAPADGSSRTHGALEQGCTGCHDPHASDHAAQLKQVAPDLCLSCHGEAMNREVEHAKVVHGALTQQGGCTTCHAPHHSPLPKLQRAQQPEQCLACHDRELTTTDGRTLANMAALLKDNPDHHGPIRDGVCTACHSPHAGQRFGMLVEEYPALFYAPFKLDTFKLCFTCHIPDLVLKEKGRGLTRFRDGDHNLHYVHVNQVKGRTCRACHEVHASKRPAHVRDAVPFGSAGWMLEINFTASAEGGTCAPACHTPRTYTRGDAVPVPLPLTPGASTTAQGVKR